MLDIVSLREQVYQYLRGQMNQHKLLPGEFIKMNAMSRELGISKTPLRDAIIQLECEGFVTILPRRGVMVNPLSLDDIRNSIEVCGALEGAVVTAVFDKLTNEHINELERLNAQMITAIDGDDFNRYYLLNLNFHDVFLNLSDNPMLKRILMPIKQRLYDFPRRAYIPEWERINCEEHREFIGYVKAGERERAVSLLRDRHWSFEVHEKFIRKFYFRGQEMIAAEQNRRR